MKISIIGLGVVGKAIKKGFEKLNHECFLLDLENKNEFPKTLNSEIIFLTLPTPIKKGTLDKKVIDYYIEKANINNYKGIIAIKSTLLPGTTDNYIKKYKKLKICYVPEFLKERSASSDFIKNHHLLIVGTSNKNIFNKIIKCHGSLPKKSSMTTAINAEFVKLFSNNYNAFRITFANNFYDIVSKTNANYNEILKNYKNLELSSGNYLKSSKNIRGFAGVCLPKDLESFINFAVSKKINPKIFREIKNYNNKIKKTVFKNMRLK